MSGRKNIALSVVLLVLVAANVVLDGGRGASGESGPVFPGLSAPLLEQSGGVARIVLRTPEGELVLERDGTPDGWRLPAFGGYPAMGFTVHDLLRRLAALDLSDVVGEAAEAAGRFGVGADGTRVRVEAVDGAVLAELVQGVPLEAEGIVGSYVRPAAGQSVVRSAGLAPLKTEPIHWIDTRLLDFDPLAVTSVRGSLLADGRRFDLVRELGPSGNASGWQDVLGLAEGPVPGVVVHRLLVTCSQLFLADVLAGGGEDVALGTVELELELEFEPRGAAEGGGTLGLRVGEPLDVGHRIATNPGWEQPWRVSLPLDTVERLTAAMAELEQAVRRVGR